MKSTSPPGVEAPSSCTLVWSKRKVQPTYEGLQAYLEEIGFQSRMEAVVVRAIVEQPEDIVDFAIGSFADCAASIDLAPSEPVPPSPLAPEATAALDLEAASLDESGENASGQAEYPDSRTDMPSALNEGEDASAENPQTGPQPACSTPEGEG